MPDRRDMNVFEDTDPGQKKHLVHNSESIKDKKRSTGVHSNFSGGITEVKIKKAEEIPFFLFVFCALIKKSFLHDTGRIFCFYYCFIILIF
jgi:hypothetical protein